MWERLMLKGKSIIKRAAVTLGATSLVTAAFLTTPANAVSNDKYGAAALCGSGYQPLDAITVLNSSTVYLSYNGAWDCVVTMHNSGTWGDPTPETSAWVDTTPNPPASQSDSGDYSYYAGPVKVYAPGQCIYWGGGDYWGHYSEGPNHCG
ncbi:spore-associated protein [Kitasatospora acidiphila]|uniref:spore-associated protein n=1 Tax=Kitasatospora acidiphila TaxID=2567942 RepID=UPI003C71DD8A